MTRILWKTCPLYSGLNQLVTILMDLPLAAARANARMLKGIERAYIPRMNRDAPCRLVKVKCTSRALGLPTYSTTILAKQVSVMMGRNAPFVQVPFSAK